MADTYTTIPHDDLAGGIDADSSEDKLADGFSEDIVNLDTAGSQLQLRPGYTLPHGFVPVKVSGIEGFAYDTTNIATLRLNLAVPCRVPGTTSYPREAKVGLWGWSTTRADVPELTYANRSRIKIFLGTLRDSTTLDLSINDSIPDTKDASWAFGGWNNRFPELWVYGLELDASNLVDSAGTDDDKAKQRIGGGYVESIQAATLEGRERLLVSSQKNLLVTRYWDEVSAQANGLDTPRHFLGIGDVVDTDTPSASGMGIPFVSGANSGLKGTTSLISPNVSSSGTLPVVSIAFSEISTDVASIEIDLGEGFGGTLDQIKTALFGFDAAAAGEQCKAEIIGPTSDWLEYAGRYSLIAADSLVDGKLTVRARFSSRLGGFTASGSPLCSIKFLTAWYSVAVHPWFLGPPPGSQAQVLLPGEGVVLVDVLGRVGGRESPTLRYSTRTSTATYTEYTFIGGDPTPEDLGPTTTYLIDWEAPVTTAFPGDHYSVARGVMRKFWSNSGGGVLRFYQGDSQPIANGWASGFRPTASFAARGIVYLDIGALITEDRLANAGSQLSLYNLLTSSGTDALSWVFYKTQGWADSEQRVGLQLYTQDVSGSSDHGIRPWFSGRRTASGFTLPYPETTQNIFAGDRIRIGSTPLAGHPAPSPQLAGNEYTVVAATKSGFITLDVPHQSLTISGFPEPVGAVVSRLIPVSSGIAELWQKPRESVLTPEYVEMSSPTDWAKDSWAPLATWRAATNITYAGGVNVTKFYSDTVIAGEYGFGAASITDRGTVFGRIQTTTNSTYVGASFGNIQYRDWIAMSPAGNVPVTYYVRANRSSVFKSAITSVGGNAYVSDGAAGRVMRYDGRTMLPAGAMDWQPGLVAASATDIGGTSAEGASFSATGRVGTSAFTASIGTAESFPIGTTFSVNNTAKTVHTVVSTDRDGNRDLIYVSPNIDIVGLPNTPILTKRAVFSYYFRLSVTDWNNNKSHSAAVQKGDFIVAVTAGAGIRMRLVAPPALPELVAAKAVDIEVYRTKANMPAPHYQVATLPVGFAGTTQYLTWLDQTPDILLTDDRLDPLPVSLNNNLGTGLTSPPAGNLAASASSRLFVADYLDKDQLEVAIAQNPSKPGIETPSLSETQLGNPTAHGSTIALGSTEYTLSPVTTTIGASSIRRCATHFAEMGLFDAWPFISVTPQPYTLPSKHPVAPGATCIRTDLYGWHPKYPTFNGAGWTARLGGTGTRTYKFTAWSGNQITMAESGHGLVVDDLIMFLEGPTTGVTNTAHYRVSAVAGALITVTDILGNAVNASGGTYNSRWVLSRAAEVYANAFGNAAGTDTLIFTLPSVVPFQRGEHVLCERLSGSGTASFLGTVTMVEGSSTGARSRITIVTDSASVTFANSDKYLIRLSYGNLRLYGSNRIPVVGSTHPAFGDMPRLASVSSSNAIEAYIKQLTDAHNSMLCINVPTSEATLYKEGYVRSGVSYPYGHFLFKSLTGSPVSCRISATEVNTDIRVRYYVDGQPAITPNVVNFSSSIRRPSRVAISLKGRPEVFDNPYVSNDTYSLSTVDVNPADGGEITGLVPFFGKSAFTAAQQEAMLLVFKPDSIYLVDVEAKFSPDSNRTVLQKLQTRNLGCSFKGAVCEVPDGVLFVHTSGVYKLKNDLTVVWVGERLERMAKTELVKGRVVSASIWPYRQKAIIGYSAGEIVGTTPSFASTQQFVYSYDKEGSDKTNPEYGAWVRYEGPPIQEGVAFRDSLAFLSWDGKVYEMRGGEEDSDFTDLGKPITFSWTYKACDFGDSGRRKVGGGVVTSFRATASLSGITVSQASDMERAFTTIADTLTIDATTHKVVSLRSSLNNRKFQYLQLKYTGSVSKPIEFTSLDFIVSGLSHKGLKQAATAAAE